ncbi:MAG: protein kinase domain-containing protein [Polyangiaceae bacterium]
MADDEILTIAKARIGRVLRGKYRLDRVLGVGGMAVVYAATHRNKKRFAIKMLHAELSMRENIRTRFLREGYVANSVEHPGAVAVLDDDVAEDGSAFVVMELLDGAAVDEVWAKYEKHVPLPLVLSIGDALLDVLVAAHAKGIVHRDIKPANLFLTNDGRLEVLDFGIARLHDETSGAQATQTGAMLGTPAYMAPEQALAESSKVDAQTDLWAVGATLFALLTGELVHPGENASQLLVAAATKKARGIASVAGEVPAAVAEVIDKALAFDKHDRWANAKEMREALAKACVSATGGPIAPLPKTTRVTGLEATIASSPELDSGAGAAASSNVGFDPTVDAPAARPSAPRDGGTTGGAVAATKESPARAHRVVPWRKVAVGGAACALIAAGAGAVAMARRPQVAFCADIQTAIDGFRCVSPLPESAVGKRVKAHAWRVTSQGGRIQRAERVTFAGTRVDDHDWEREIIRDEDGSVREIVSRDPHGNIAEWQKWSDGGRRVDFVDIDGKTPRHILSGEDEDDPVSRVTAIRFEYDARGIVARETYLGASGKPRPAWDAYGRSRVNGRAGRTTREQNLASDGEPGSDPAGVSIVEDTDDDSPEGTDSRFLDIQGRPVCNANGIHHFHKDFDDSYEWKAFMNFGLHDEPTVIMNLGTHGILFTWDAAKRVEEQTTVDERGHPRPWKGNAASIERNTYDDRGRFVLDELFDANRNHVMRHPGASTTRFAYDEHDNAVDIQAFDPSGAPMLNDIGTAHRVALFDEHGRMVERRYFDTAGRPSIRRDMGAIVTMGYDERGLQVTEGYLDADRHPVANTHGYATKRMKYDRLRNQVEKAFFGPDGHACVDDDGTSIIRHAYDDNDDLVAVSYFDATGAPTIHKGEWATKKLKNDERGLVVEEAYFDAHGEPMLLRDGYARVTYVRDRNGDVVEEAYFGKRDEPVARTGGYARRTIAHDLHRLTVETRLFDVKGAATTGTDGWAIERTAYEDRGLVVRHDHLDAAAKPVATRNGASDTKAYDGRGNVIEEATLGVDGKPFGSEAGYATKKSSYDERDELVEEDLLAADGKLALGKDGWAIRKLRYDDNGNVVEESFYDGEHRPVALKDASHASVRSRFDARQHLLESSYFDPAGTPVRGPEGAAVVRYQRDANGRTAEAAYFDGSGTPTRSKDGAFVVRSSYDSAGRLVDERFVDAAGAPHPGADGCSSRHTKYDAQGRKAEESCLDAKDAPALCADGWAIRRTLHDARGNDVDVTSYGPDGALRGDKDGVARRKNRFDERNLLLETTFFDASDKPAHDKRGVHAIRFTYDDAGKKTGETSFDERGKAVATKPSTDAAAKKPGE